MRKIHPRWPGPDWDISKDTCQGTGMQVLMALRSHRPASLEQGTLAPLHPGRGQFSSAGKPTLPKQPLSLRTCACLSTEHIHEIISITIIRANTYEHLLYLRHILSTLYVSCNSHNNPMSLVLLFSSVYTRHGPRSCRYCLLPLQKLHHSADLKEY